MSVRDVHIHSQCTRPIEASPESCQYILDEMLRTKFVERMGKAPDRGVTVSLPIILRARRSSDESMCMTIDLANANLSNQTADGQCQVILDTLGATVTTTWSEVWMAIKVVNAKCVRAGHGGQAVVAATIPGTSTPSEELRIAIMDEPTPLALASKPNDTQPGAVKGATALKGE